MDCPFAGLSFLRLSLPAEGTYGKSLLPEGTNAEEENT